MTVPSPLQLQLDAIRKEINEIVLENQSPRSDREKLHYTELIVNQGHFHELQKRMELRVIQAQDEIVSINTETKNKIKNIKTQCWDSMAVKMDFVTGLLNPDLKVSNYPIPKKDSNSENLINQVITASKINMLSDGLPTKCLLYKSNELCTEERIRSQIVLLQAEIHQHRVQFNKNFEALVRSKTELINGKISEKIDRINDLMEEFALINGNTQPLVKLVPETDQSCSGEQLFEEYEQMESNHEPGSAINGHPDPGHAAACDEVSGDQKAQRALDDMMGGQLQTQEEQVNPKNRITVLLNSVHSIPKPEFLSAKKNPDEYTDEEKRALGVYEKKIQAVHDEIEKNKRSIETELRTNQAQLDELKAQFDRVKLTQLFDEKLGTDLVIHQHELQICIQTKRLVAVKSGRTECLYYETKANDQRHQINEMSSSMNESVVSLLKEKLEVLVQKEKEMDKAYKRELTVSNLGVPVSEVLWALYKAPVDQCAGAVINSKSEVQELNEAQMEIKTKLTPQQVAKLNEYRDQKTKLEVEMRGVGIKLNQAETQNETVVRKITELKTQLEETEATIGTLKEKIEACLSTGIDLYQLKQGQIEIPTAPVITDYLSKSIKLMPTKIVEELNMEIKKVGSKQLSAKQEMRNYNRQIVQLKFEIEVLEFKCQDTQIQLNHLHLLKLNKSSIHEYLNHSDTHYKTVNTLERQLEHMDAMFKTRREAKVKVVETMTRQLHLLVAKNADLASRISRLRGWIQRDGQILPPESVVVGGHSLLVKRNKLKHSVQSQKMDIELLTNEVFRWKLKTFPSFS